MRINKRGSILSWSALFAGAIGGVGLNFLFNLLALAIGLASFSVNGAGKTFFSLGGFLIFGLFSILSMFFTGWIAGILSPTYFSANLKRGVYGLLVGFLSWCILLILTIILLMNTIQFVSFHSNFTSNLVAIKVQNNSPMLTETKAHHLKISPLSFNIDNE